MIRWFVSFTPFTLTLFSVYRPASIAFLDSPDRLELSNSLDIALHS